MNFFDVLNKRRSVRKFLDEKVPDEVMEIAFESAFKAPNSSNLQPWEFYWIKDEEKRKLLNHSCFSQKAATTASELVFAVARVDTWKRNRNLLIKQLEKQGKIPSGVQKYYNKVVPFSYTQDPLNFVYILKKIIVTFAGFFGPSPRKPGTRAELFEVVTKTTALACQNFMLSLVAQGYDSCPMEGYDEKRVKKILKLGRSASIVMAIGVGKRDDSGVYGEQFRIPKEYTLFKV